MAQRRSPVLLLLLAGIAALVAFLAFWALRDDAPGDAPPPPPAAGTAVATPRPARPPVAKAKTPRVTIGDTQGPEIRPPETPISGAGGPIAGALTRSMKLTVTVRRSNGGPASRAVVLALDPLGSYLTPPAPAVRAQKEADGDGKAVFDITGGTTVLRVLAALDGEAGISDYVNAQTGDAAVTVDLGLAFAVAATTVDPDGQPVAGATVTLSVAEATWPLVVSSTTGPDGRTTLPPIPAPGPNAWIQWHATAAGRAPASRAGRQTDAADVRLVLERAATVRGRVVGEDGQPRAADVRIGEVTVAAKDDGQFEITALPPSGGTLVARARDGSLAIVRGLRGDGGDLALGDVVVHPGDRIAGHVVDGSEQPLAGIVTTLTVEDTDVVIEATTDAAGKFVLEHVPVGEHTVLAAEPLDRPGWSTRRKTTVGPVRTGTVDVRIVLDGRATVVLRFLNDSDRSPVRVASAKLTATAVGTTPAENAWAWSGAGIEGVRFEPDSTGVFDLTIEVPGWAPGTVKAVEVLADRELTIDVLFRKGE